MDEEEAVLLLALDEVGYLWQVTKMYAVSIEKSSQYKKIFIFYFICRKKRRWIHNFNQERSEYNLSNYILRNEYRSDKMCPTAYKNMKYLWPL